MVEKNLINLLKSGDTEALEYLIDSYCNLIFKVCYTILNDRELSKECVNDVLLKIWDNIEGFYGEEKQFKNWICTISKYTAIDRLRREEKKNNYIELKENLISNSNIEEAFQYREELESVIKNIEEFSLKDKEIFYRRFILGETLGEISDKLKLTEKYIGQRISRCRKLLKSK